MFWVKTMVAFVVISAILILGGAVERNLARRSRPFLGLILPLVTGILAVALSVPNFIQSVSYPPSLVALAASVALFVFYMIPAMTFMLIYMETRDMQKTKSKTRRNQSLDARRKVSHARMEVRRPSDLNAGNNTARTGRSGGLSSRPTIGRSEPPSRSQGNGDRRRESNVGQTGATSTRPSWVSNPRPTESKAKKEDKRSSDWPKKRWH